MVASILSKEKNAAFTAASCRTEYSYVKTGAGRPVGRPPKAVFGGAQRGNKLSRCRKGTGREANIKAGRHGDRIGCSFMTGSVWRCRAGPETLVRVKSVTGAGWGLVAASDIPALAVLGQLPLGKKLKRRRPKKNRFFERTILSTASGDHFMGQRPDSPRSERCVRALWAALTRRGARRGTVAIKSCR